VARGRPRKPHDQKLRVVSVSITPLQVQILEQLCTRNDVSRSEMIRALIEGAGYLELGVVGGVHPHIQMKQNYTLQKSGLQACNPHSKRGECLNSACQAAYKKERALTGGVLRNV